VKQSESTKIIEWNVDFDKRTISVPDFFNENGAARSIKYKGRCRFCWGNLIGRLEGQAITAIRCCVCGLRVEGDEAHLEYEKMQAATAITHLQSYPPKGLRVTLERPPEYQEGKMFISKLFPSVDHPKIDPDSQQDTCGLTRGQWLIRREFSPGTLGWFILQAHALISSIRYDKSPSHIVHSPHIELKEDGTATVQGVTDAPSPIRESQVMQILGSTMANALLSAFACELVMKGIALSVIGKARKTHNLHELYCDLPDTSKERIEKDAPDIEYVLKRTQDTFGKWRYLQEDVAEAAIGAMVDYDRNVLLGRIARILLDEAEIVGLGYSASLKIKQEIYKENKHTKLKGTMHKIDVEGREKVPYEREWRHLEECLSVENHFGKAYLTHTLRWER